MDVLTKWPSPGPLAVGQWFSMCPWPRARHLPRWPAGPAIRVLLWWQKVRDSRSRGWCRQRWRWWCCCCWWWRFPEDRVGRPPHPSRGHPSAWDSSISAATENEMEIGFVNLGWELLKRDAQIFIIKFYSLYRWLFTYCTDGLPRSLLFLYSNKKCNLKRTSGWNVAFYGCSF